VLLVVQVGVVLAGAPATQSIAVQQLVDGMHAPLHAL
jgi:hypothetical protein